MPPGNSAKAKFPWNSPEANLHLGWSRQRTDMKQSLQRTHLRWSLQYIFTMELTWCKEKKLGYFDLFFVSFSYADSIFTLLSVKTKWCKEREWNETVLSMFYTAHR